MTRPVVLDVTTGAVWVSNQAQTDGCQLPVYSPALQLLIESRDSTVWLRRLDGYIQQSYKGSNPLHIGNSGLKLLAGDTWIDLTTGEQVMLPIDEPSRLRKVAWTDNDTRFYACCALYGDASASTFYRRDLLGDIFPGGIGVGPGYSGELTQWFGDGKFVMHEAGAVQWAHVDGADVATLDRPPVTPTLPMIDPVNQSYINLGAELGLTQTFDCYWTYRIRPFHDQVWLLNCTDEGLLVDVPALTAQTIAGFTFMQWSPNGRFALLTADDHFTLLDPDNMTFTPLPDVPSTAVQPTWSPQADYLAFVGAENEGLFLVETAVGHSRTLPALHLNGQLSWRPESDVIAAAMEDGTVLLISIAGGHGEYITPAYSNVRDLRWSPNGRYLALVTGQDVVIVTD